MPNTTYKRKYKKGTKANPVMKREMAKVANKVLKAHQESKFHDNDDLGSGISDAGTLFDLSLIPQGDTDQTRDGDQIYLKSIMGRYSVTGSDNSNIIRVIIVQYITENAGLTGTKILQALGAGAVFQNYAHDYKSQVRILYDKTHTMGNATTASIPLVKTYKVMITKGFKRKIQYLGGGTNTVGGIRMFVVSDSAAASHPVIAFSLRLNYTDS